MSIDPDISEASRAPVEYFGRMGQINPLRRFPLNANLENEFKRAHPDRIEENPPMVTLQELIGLIIRPLKQGRISDVVPMEILETGYLSFENLGDAVWFEDQQKLGTTRGHLKELLSYLLSGPHAAEEAVKNIESDFRIAADATRTAAADSSKAPNAGNAARR